jgi:energy-converting hydrogenase Eha subunit G
MGAASATGESGAASATGKRGKVMGANGCALFLVHRAADGSITQAWAGIAGRHGIKPMTWYSLDANGVPQEVV